MLLFCRFGVGDEIVAVDLVVADFVHVDDYLVVLEVVISN